MLDHSAVMSNTGESPSEQRKPVRTGLIQSRRGKLVSPVVTQSFICWDEQLENTLGNRHALLVSETPLTEESPRSETLAA